MKQRGDLLRLLLTLIALLLPILARAQATDKFIASLNADERKDLKALQNDWTKHEKMSDFNSYQANALVVSQVVLGTLGYGTKFTGIEDAQTKEAIAAYQSNRDISPSGVIDAETFWSLTRDSDWVDERVTSMISFDLYWYDDSVTANGVWDRMNDKASYLESTDIECDRAKGKCVEADAMLSFNVLVAKQTEFEVTKWDEYEVVAEDSTPACERDELRINHQEKSVTVISTPTYKNESCKKALGKPETVTYRLVSGTEIAADRSRALQLHRKTLYLLTANARATLDKKN